MATSDKTTLDLYTIDLLGWELSAAATEFSRLADTGKPPSDLASAHFIRTVRTALYGLGHESPTAFALSSDNEDGTYDLATLHQALSIATSQYRSLPLSERQHVAPGLQKIKTILLEIATELDQNPLHIPTTTISSQQQQFLSLKKKLLTSSPGVA